MTDGNQENLETEEELTTGEATQETGGGEGDEFEKERALETIRKQRESEKKLKAELKAATARLQAIDEAERKRQEAEKSELQIAQEKATQLEQSLREAQETAQALRLRQAFLKEARKQELNFANVTAEDDAFLLADLDGVEIDAEGNVAGLEEAIKRLQKSRPYLFAQAKEQAGDGNGTPPRNNGKGKLNKEAIQGLRVRL